DVNARSAIRDYQRVATAESRSKSLDRGGFTPLMYAARENCGECADMLLEAGADVNLPDPAGVPPLLIAMMNGNWDIANGIVAERAHARRRHRFAQSPLRVALADGGRRRGHTGVDSGKRAAADSAELVQLARQGGPNPNQQTDVRPAVRGGGRRRTPPFV